MNSFNKKIILLVLLLSLYVTIFSQPMQAKLITSNDVELIPSEFYFMYQFVLNEDEVVKLKIRIKSDYNETELSNVQLMIFESSLTSNWINYLDNYYPSTDLKPSTIRLTSLSGMSTIWKIKLVKGNYTFGIIMNSLPSLVMTVTLIQMDWYNYTWVWVLSSFLLVSFITIGILLLFPQKLEKLKKFNQYIIKKLEQYNYSNKKILYLIFFIITKALFVTGLIVTIFTFFAFRPPCSNVYLNIFLIIATASLETIFTIFSFTPAVSWFTNMKLNTLVNIQRILGTILSVILVIGGGYVVLLLGMYLEVC